MEPLLDCIRADFRRYGLSTAKGIRNSILGVGTIQAVVLFRLSHWCYLRPWLRWLSWIFFKTNLVLYAIEIAPSAQIGPGLRVPHTLGTAIGSRCIIGRNVTIYHNVSIGSRDREQDGQEQPRIGDGAVIAVGALVLGPISIGEGATVGAGAVVIKDVPAGDVVVGNPARSLSGRA